MTDYDLVQIKRALISVSDKSGLVELGRALVGAGVEIVSTGGSAQALKQAGVAVTEVADFTGFPEILDGRVKTLHPRIHGGILAKRDDASHRGQMDRHSLPPIDLVVANLYPFQQTVAAGADRATSIENIDIGGPALIRSAAKNHAYVTVLVHPEQYTAVISALGSESGTRLPLRRQLAAAAFAHTAAYDSAIAAWAAREEGVLFPDRIAFSGRLRQTLRYGENPHQQAALYVSDNSRPGVADATQLQGKELSYNNLNDTDAAFELA